MVIKSDHVVQLNEKWTPWQSGVERTNAQKILGWVERLDELGTMRGDVRGYVKNALPLL